MTDDNFPVWPERFTFQYTQSERMVILKIKFLHFCHIYAYACAHVVNLII